MTADDHKHLDAKQRILRSTLKEFAAKGFSGARMEAIAGAAHINKAMIFYYFQNKEQLYKMVLKDCLVRLFSAIGNVLNPSLTPEEFFEKFPRIYITFFKDNPDFIKIIGVELIQNPKFITTAINEILGEISAIHPKHILLGKIQGWVSAGQVRETDPRHLIINVFSLSLFAFIAVPMIETISGLKIEMNDEFFEHRITSAVNLLKRGMLP